MFRVNNNQNVYNIYTNHNSLPIIDLNSNITINKNIIDVNIILNIDENIINFDDLNDNLNDDLKK